ncbi:MAG: MFS transporter [Ramlibacter sp.]
MTAAPPRALAPAMLATLLAACLIALLSFGVRSAFGLFTDPLSRELGLSREVYAIAIAVQNLAWGLAQPLAGIVADRRGARPVLLAGAALYAAGIVGLAFATTPAQVVVTAGVLVGLGMGGASYITVLAALGRAMPEAQRSWALGLGTAAGSLGQFVVVPLTQAVIGVAGWRSGAWMMAAATALTLLVALAVRGDRPQAPATSAAPRTAVLAVVATALRHPSYVLLVLGFFVCGFQLAFITTHFPAYLADRGMGASVASWAIAMVGLFNVAGAYLAGVWGGRGSRKNLLACVYAGRALVLLLFVLLPTTPASVLAFGAAMGLLWLSTVPPTSALVATFFGTRYMATLFGLAFFSHQVGSFFGVYLGGRLYALTGSYDLVWWCCIALSVVAALVNLPIREDASRAFARLAAA